MNSYSISAISAIILSFLITLFLGKILIPYLQKLKYGQKILEIGPSWHKSKEGTPTMGGIMFIIGITISTAICVPGYYLLSDYFGVNVTETPLMMVKIFAGLGAAFANGLVGMFDDFVKIAKKQNKGLSPKQKLIFQFGITLLYFVAIHYVNLQNGVSDLTSVKIPFFGSVNFGIFYWIIFALVIVGITNAANLTDGIDGLCASIAFFIAIFCMIILNILGMFGLSIEAAALAGGCLGFLFWNFYPAKIFMGDTGSLFLGSFICMLCIGGGLYVPLIILCGVYILEMLSVILQVIYFKISHGKRLFKMSPLHHHFEMCGWNETKICTVASIATCILGILTVLLITYAM